MKWMKSEGWAIILGILIIIGAARQALAKQ